MSHLLTVEVTAENIVDLMMEDPNFAADLLQKMATAIHAGRLRDDAADICAGMESGQADRIAKAFQSLSEAITDGFNMSHIDVQI